MPCWSDHRRTLCVFLNGFGRALCLGSEFQPHVLLVNPREASHIHVFFRVKSFLKFYRNELVSNMLSCVSILYVDSLMNASSEKKKKGLNEYPFIGARGDIAIDQRVRTDQACLGLCVFSQVSTCVFFFSYNSNSQFCVACRRFSVAVVGDARRDTHECRSFTISTAQHFCSRRPTCAFDTTLFFSLGISHE